jgi:hypothetical protein
LASPAITDNTRHSQQGKARDPFGRMRQDQDGSLFRVRRLALAVSQSAAVGLPERDIDDFSMRSTSSLNLTNSK